MKKILFGITSLTLGGAERVLVDLSNKLCESYDITILTIYDCGKLKKQLNDKIHVISLYSKKYEDYSKLEHIKISLSLIFKTRITGDYDTIVAFLEGPITRLFSKNKNIRKIAWVHNDISKVFGRGIKAKLKRHLDKNMYKKYDKIIFVSNENKDDFNQIYGSEFDEEVIRNYLDYEKVNEKSKENIELPYDNSNINMVSVCRLVEQKGLDRFIRVATKLKKDGIKFKVYIVGDGPIKSTLQKQIDDEGLKNEFYLLGAKENPYPYIKKADYFCLLSYYEGYGMVLEEAKILNKPIIITNTAAVESVQDYEKAVILENTEDGIYDGIKEVLKRENSQLKEESIDENKKYEDIYSEILKNIYDIL